MDSKDEMEIYSLFPVILQQRLTFSHKTANNLADFSLILARCFNFTDSSSYLKELLDEKVDDILTDCNASFRTVSYERGADIMLELSNLATIYLFFGENDPTYKRICYLIKNRPDAPIVVEGNF